MEEDNRRDSVAAALEPVMEEGEQYKVFCHEGKIYVEDEATSPCAVRHPRLYGRLLAVNTQLEQAGAGLGKLPTLLALSFCVGLELGWWREWLGAGVDNLKSWWFYLLVFFVLFQALHWIGNVMQRGVYRRSREELLNLIAAEGLDRDLLAALIAGDPAVERIDHHLCLDTDVPAPREASRTPETRG